jgi:glutamate---cysteine ligase / carboxylate-amine ligase
MGLRSLGVEEELLLVDRETGRLTAVADQAVRAHESDLSAEDDAAAEPELFRQQIETMTEPCETLDELAAQLRTGRRTLTDLAREVGAAAVAVPAPVHADARDDITRARRYERIRQTFGEIARTSLVCAMHVHVDIADPDEGVLVLDRIRPWLPVLLAVSANSPYFQGRDTGYASWRTQIWSRWPSHGTGEAFGSPAVYDEVRRQLTAWGAALDDGMVYFDARLSAKYPTLEVRLPDVCTDPEDALLVAAFVRGLAETLAQPGPGERGQHGEVDAPWRSDLLRAATWRASKFGLADQLVHPVERQLAPAREVLEAMIDLVRPALEDASDLDVVEDLVHRLFSRGTGAVRQRRVYEKHGSLEKVVADLVARTEESGADRPTWLVD